MVGLFKGIRFSHLVYGVQGLRIKSFFRCEWKSLNGANLCG